MPKKNLDNIREELNNQKLATEKPVEPQLPPTEEVVPPIDNLVKNEDKLPLKSKFNFKTQKNLF